MHKYKKNTAYKVPLPQQYCGLIVGGCGQCFTRRMAVVRRRATWDVHSIRAGPAKVRLLYYMKSSSFTSILVGLLPSNHWLPLLLLVAVCG